MLAQYRVLSATLRVCVSVWCQTSEFCTNLPGKLITSDIKIFVQNKIFSRPTDPAFWAVQKKKNVCNRNQIIISVQPYLYNNIATRS